MNLSETVAQRIVEKLGCQYMGPIQDPNQPVQYCGHTVVKGKSYCATHYPMIYQNGSATVKKASAKVVAKKQQVWAPGELEDLMWECYEELLADGEIFE